MEAAETELTFFAAGYSAPPADAAARPDKRVKMTMSFGDPGAHYCCAISGLCVCCVSTAAL